MENPQMARNMYSLLPVAIATLGLGVSLTAFATPSASFAAQLKQPPKSQPSPTFKNPSIGYISCKIEKDYDEGQAGPFPIVRLANKTQQTFQIGTRIRWKMNTGHTGVYVLPFLFPPGKMSMPIDVPPAWQTGLTCSAKLQQRVTIGPVGSGDLRNTLK